MSWSSEISTPDQGAELFGWLEDRDLKCRDFDGRPGAGISCHAGFSAADLESAETADFDILLMLERFLDRFEEGVDNARAVLLRDHGPRSPRNLGGDSDQVCFSHCSALELALPDVA